MRTVEEVVLARTDRDAGTVSRPRAGRMTVRMDSPERLDTYDTPREACEGADKYMAAHKEWDAMRLRPPPFPREVRVVERTTTETVVGTWVK